MKPENLLLLERRQKFRSELAKNPLMVDKFRCRKSNIRLLIVADGFLFFNNENFGLSDLVSVIEGTRHPSAEIQVVRAHRGAPGDERLNGAEPNFKFSHETLRRVDVVMLFAAERDNERLSQSELNALATFMDNGGGLFATGDHESLGRAMCGDLLRVRSMRKWYYPEEGPFGEPVAPDGSNALRHDTNRPGHDRQFSFNDQSDDIPQRIMPLYEKVSQYGLHQIHEPHPVLCGPQGVIDVLPDHPHEGECITPWEFDRSFSYNGETFKEYPKRIDGQQPLPKIIAIATLLPGAEVPGSKPPTTGGTFGVISAYDGHLANVGRVCCDATWHHFININLTGDDNLPDSDPKSLGFLASNQGENAYEKVKAYFRNIVTWLAPIRSQRCMRNRYLWNLTRKPQFREVLHINKLMASDELSLQQLVKVGMSLNRIPELDPSLCLKRRLLIDILAPELDHIPEFSALIIPSLPENNLTAGSMPGIDSEFIMNAALGGIAMELVRESIRLELERQEAPSDEALEELVGGAARTVLKMVADDIQQTMKRFERISKKLSNIA